MELVLLRMKSGKALRTALLESLEDVPPGFRPIFSVVYESIFLHSESFKKPIHKEITDIYTVLREAGETGSRAVERLQSLRVRLQMLSEFRNKSRSALLRTRIQAYGGAVIFFAAVGFGVQIHGFETMLGVVSLGLPLLTAGVLWILREGRTIRWKI